MSRPARHASPEGIHCSARTFFATTRTSQGRCLLQSERNATLMIDVLRSYLKARKFRLHDLVIMPDHVHVLLTVGAGMTIERVMQFIKGGFSHAVKTELGSNMEVWQKGFSDHRIRDGEDLAVHLRYIHENPVRAHLVETAGEYEYSSAHGGIVLDEVPQRLKPLSMGAAGGAAEAAPFQSSSQVNRAEVEAACPQIEDLVSKKD